MFQRDERLLFLEEKFALQEAADRKGVSEDPQVSRLLQALWEGAYHFEPEHWHNPAPQIGSPRPHLPAEMLLRVTDESVDRAGALKALLQNGLHVELDRLLVPAALEEAKREGLPCVSVNVTLGTLTALARDGKSLGLPPGYAPHQVVLEILETPEGASAEVTPEDLNVLAALDRMGHPLALDDVGANGPQDLERLAALGKEITYVKIDGALVERWWEKRETGFEDIVRAIQAMRRDGTCRPDARIIAEWVPDARVAARIFSEMGIHAVQGRDLIAGNFMRKNGLQLPLFPAAETYPAPALRM